MKTTEIKYYVGAFLILSATIVLSGYQLLQAEKAFPHPIWEQESQQELLLHEDSYDDLIEQSSGLGFRENMGQIQSPYDIKYVLETAGVSCYLAADGIKYVWVNPKNFDLPEEKYKEEVLENSFNGYESAEISMTWLGANEGVEIIPEMPNSDMVHYYTEDHPDGLMNVKSYRKITYVNIYNNIDFVIYLQEDELKYDFIVKPGGNVQDIQMRYSGQRDLELEKDGGLNIISALGELREGVPYSYQSRDSIQRKINSEYRLEEGVISFEVGAYDVTRELVIDPTLKWATYYGKGASEIGQSTATDKKGNVYVAGIAYGHGSGLAAGSYYEHYSGERDAMLIKFNASGDRIWATYYGGGEHDGGLDVCVDKFNNVYLTGFTDSNEGIASGGHDNTLNETNQGNGTRFKRDAFLVKFYSTGFRDWATYYGGEDFLGGHEKREVGQAVCTDNEGNVYLAGFTTSEEYIAHNGHDNTFGGEKDAFLVKFSSHGNRIWATYYGGSKDDRAEDIAVDSWGRVYMTGHTESTGLAFEGQDHTYAGEKDAFLVRFDQNGNRQWATYYGGSGMDVAHSVETYLLAVYISGITTSNSSIAYNGHDNTYNGNKDAFLVKFNFEGSRIWGTYYGGSGDESYLTSVEQRGTSQITVSKNGDIYLSGTTQSSTKIATSNTYDNSYNGNRDAFLARFNQSGDLQWGTYFGGSSSDICYGLITDIMADVYIVGSTTSPSGIAKNGWDDTFDDSESTGNHDIFLAKFKPYGRGGPGGGPGGVTTIFNAQDPNIGTESGTQEAYSLESSHAFSEVPVQLFPNPATDQVQIIYTNRSQNNVQLKVMDVTGKIVFEQLYQGDTITEAIDVSSFIPGVYFVSIDNEMNHLTEKFIVK